MSDDIPSSRWLTEGEPLSNHAIEIWSFAGRSIRDVLSTHRGIATVFTAFLAQQAKARQPVSTPETS
jgi:hypothetical protein